MDKLATPWTPEQVEALNAWQLNDEFHPFTCGNPNKNKENHPDGGEGVLYATPNGWRCAYCNYTQNWAHGFMAEKR